MGKIAERNKQNVRKILKNSKARIASLNANRTRDFQERLADGFTNYTALQERRQQRANSIKDVNRMYTELTQDVLNDKALDFLIKNSQIGVPTITSIFAGFELARASRAEKLKEVRDNDLNAIARQDKLDTDEFIFQQNQAEKREKFEDKQYANDLAVLQNQTTQDIAAANKQSTIEINEEQLDISQQHADVAQKNAETARREVEGKNEPRILVGEGEFSELIQPNAPQPTTPQTPVSQPVETEPPKEITIRPLEPPPVPLPTVDASSLQYNDNGEAIYQIGNDQFNYATGQIYDPSTDKWVDPIDDTSDRYKLAIDTLSEEASTALNEMTEDLVNSYNQFVENEAATGVTGDEELSILSIGGDSQVIIDQNGRILDPVGEGFIPLEEAELSDEVRKAIEEHIAPPEEEENATDSE